VFVVNADSAVQLSINGKVILDHYESNPKVGWKKYSWGD